MPASIVWNRKPLPQNLLSPLPPTAVRARDWLAERVAAEAPTGMLGRLSQAGALFDRQRMDRIENEVRACLLNEEDLPDDMLRALMSYQAVTADKTVALRLMRGAKSLRERLLAGEKLPPERAANVGELLRMALWLYNLTGQQGLLALCRMLKAQAPDWMSTFHVFAQTKAVREAPGTGEDAYWRVHGATVAASLKTPALQALFEGGLKNETAFDTAWEKLMRCHGTALGVYNAAPLLGGNNPSMTVEPEVIDELLHTLVTLLWAEGTAQTGDLLEHVVYGAAMGAGGAQAANQFAGKGALEGCWSLFASSLWMASSDEGLAVVGYAPCEVRWRLADNPVRIRVETRYPYEDSVRFEVHMRRAAAFALRLRIPRWAQDALVTVNGEAPQSARAGTFHLLRRTWDSITKITLTLPASVQTRTLYHQSLAVTCGPLVYAMPIEQEAPWQMALLPDHGFERGTRAGIPVIYADAALAPQWRQSGDVPGALPVLPAVRAEDIRRVALYPLGESPARIAQFPSGRMEEQESKEGPQ